MCQNSPSRTPRPQPRPPGSPVTGRADRPLLVRPTNHSQLACRTSSPVPGPHVAPPHQSQPRMSHLLAGPSSAFHTLLTSPRTTSLRTSRTVPERASRPSRHSCCRLTTSLVDRYATAFMNSQWRFELHLRPAWSATSESPPARQRARQTRRQNAAPPIREPEKDQAEWGRIADCRMPAVR